jgi:Rrf2 family protein
MLRLSKKVEYGLIALRHLALLPQGGSATAREIAEEYTLPYELCAKTLSQVSKAGLATSTQGVRGGYALAKAPGKINLHEVIEAIEGEPALTECMEIDAGGCACALDGHCAIKDPLRRVQENITRAFAQMTLAEML